MNKKLLITTGLCTLLNCFGIVHAGIPRPTYSIELTQGFSSTMQVASNATAKINYTVKNLEPIPRILMMLPIAPPAIGQVVTAPGSCTYPVFFLSGGQSCTLELQVNGAFIAAGQMISSFPTVCKTKAPGSIEPDTSRCSRASVPLNISSTNINPNIPVNQAIAFGSVLIQNALFPLQANVPIGSTPWKVKPAFSFIWRLLSGGFNIPTTLNMVSSSCGSAVGSSFCALVGSDENSNLSLLTSTDGGLHWSPAIAGPNGIPTAGSYSSISCATTSTGNNVCAAIGIDAGSSPFIVQTVNNGASWDRIPTSSAIDLSLATLSNVNCFANDSNVLCQVTGSDSGAGPVIYYNYSGTSWNTLNLAGAGISSSSSTGALSCAPTPATTDISCIVALNGNGSSYGLIKTQLLGAVNFSFTAVNNLSTFLLGNTLKSVSCAVRMNQIFCSAAGGNASNSLLLQNQDISSDAGWGVASLPTPTGTSLVSVSCTEFNGQVLCNTAGGSELYSTIDSGSNWVAPAIANASVAVKTYQTTSATVSQGKPLMSATAIAAAADGLTLEPKIVSSTAVLGAYNESQTLVQIFAVKQ